MVPHATATYATYTRIAPAAERCGALTRRPATACRGDFHRRTRRAPPPRHRNRWAATALRGRTPGLPPRGGRARRRILVGTLAAMPAAWAVGVAAAADAAGLETQAPAGDAPSPCSSTNFVVADVGIEHLQSEGLASRVVPSSRRGSRAGRYRRSRRGAERRRWSRFPTSGAVRESTTRLPVRRRRERRLPKRPLRPAARAVPGPAAGGSPGAPGGRPDATYRSNRPFIQRQSFCTTPPRWRSRAS